MPLSVNTNVSSLTAQRFLAESARSMDLAMERLSTGSKINGASDDAAGLAIVQRMSAQINGLTMAVKNANDGIAMTQSIEGALVEVTDMLQRLRELSIQAANATNTDIDRGHIQEEVNLLIAEISRISANTRYNGQKVLDGSFSNIQLQVGTESGETINFSVDSTAASELGSFKVTGDRIEAQLGNGAGSYENIVDSQDDIIINGVNLSKTIDVIAGDSAKAVASKINAVSGETGVEADAKNYAHLYTSYATDETYSIKINNVTTGYFAISGSNVMDAVDKINRISGSTGVTAQATTDNKVRLLAADGRDILIENESSGTNLRVQSVGHDGGSRFPSMIWHRALAEATGGSGIQLGALNTDIYTLVQKGTGQTWTFSINATTSGEPSAQNIQEALNRIVGVTGFRANKINGNLTDIQITATEDFGAFDIYKDTDITNTTKRKTFDGVGRMLNINASVMTAATHNLVLTNNSKGQKYAFSVAFVVNNGAANAMALQTAINNIPEISGFTAYACIVMPNNVHLHGPAAFGNWTLSGLSNIDSDELHAGDLNYFDRALSFGGDTEDASTITGTIELTSSRAFSVNQKHESSGVVTDPTVATGSMANDNFFVTRSSDLSSIANLDIRTTAKAGESIKTIDGAIEKISVMRSKLGAIANRLQYTVSSLVNVRGNTAVSKSRINDADFSVESANLAKSQVLQRAGFALLAQANARSQLVLQLLQ